MAKALSVYTTRSGEALERIYGTMKNIFKMDMVSGPLRLKSSVLGGGRQMAQDYGRKVGGSYTKNNKVKMGGKA